METWRTLHLQRILHTLDAISVHGGVSPGEPLTLALRSGAQYTTDSILGNSVFFFKYIYVI